MVNLPQMDLIVMMKFSGKTSVRPNPITLPETNIAPENLWLEY